MRQLYVIFAPASAEMIDKWINERFETLILHKQVPNRQGNQHRNPVKWLMAQDEATEQQEFYSISAGIARFEPGTLWLLA